jgi:hypothetical protein
MLIWLASYPRSGNTFARIILNRVFDLKTLSWSDDGDSRVFDCKPGMAEMAGHENCIRRGEQLIFEAQNSNKLYIIKTHEAPLTDDPAIFIVRDGRSALVSYYHYLNEIENYRVTMNTLIDGQVYPGSWSQHFSNWRPTTRANTVILRYEQMTRKPKQTIQILGDFISAKPLASTLPNFDDLHKFHPKFFRKGDDACNICEMAPYLEQFSRAHGGLMRDLGYACDAPQKCEMLHFH